MEKSKSPDFIEYAYDILHKDGKSIILFYVPYTPFKEKEGAAYIDSFYIASNTAYNYSLKIAKTLEGMGYSCIPNPDIDYKEAARACGLAWGKNTLSYKSGLGSRFAIGAVQTDAVFEEKTDCRPVPMPCLNCGLCAAACPGGAIGDNGFCREKCMREYMLRPEKAGEAMLKAFGNRIIGCDICQKVCPVNTTDEKDMPDGIYKMLEYGTLLKSIEKEDLKEFGGYFGYNYCNRNSLLSMLLIAMANSGNAMYRETALKYLDSKSERVRAAAEYALKKSDGK